MRVFRVIEPYINGVKFAVIYKNSFFISDTVHTVHLKFFKEIKLREASFAHLITKFSKREVKEMTFLDLKEYFKRGKITNVNIVFPGDNLLMETKIELRLENL